MHRLDRVLRALVALLLVLALGSAPVVDALAHGPGTLAAEADHANWHAERGEIWQADGHQHHDSTDHDHSTVIILANQDAVTFDPRSAIQIGDLLALSGATQDGPRRPPRGRV